jgi:hypothetical protein
MEEIDIRDTKGRLFRLGLAVAASTLFTVVCMTAMIHDGRGPSKDGMGQAMPAIMAIVMFVLVTHVAHKLVVRVHENRRAARR